MPFDPIDIGTAPGDGTGDPARVAFDKINTMFQELFATQNGPTIIPVNEVAHGFADNQWIERSGGTWSLGDASADSTSDVQGVVRVVDVDNFNLVIFGFIDGFVGLSAGDTYYLSDSTPGAITNVAPTGIGVVQKPVLKAITSTEGIVQYMPGWSSAAEPVP